jgi:hypothetical protein
MRRSQTSPPLGHALPRQLRGTAETMAGAIDIVVNLFTPREVQNNQTRCGWRRT